jgi:hypothetical protein
MVTIKLKLPTKLAIPAARPNALRITSGNTVASSMSPIPIPSHSPSGPSG